MIFTTETTQGGQPLVYIIIINVSLQLVIHYIATLYSNILYLTLVIAERKAFVVTSMYRLLCS